MANMEIPYVNLYGWNIDTEELEKQIPNLKDSSQIQEVLRSCSPTLIATAAAGISHQERNFEELRERYRDSERLRELGERLVQMGHASIVEHMFFNFDVVLTRLAVEFLEAHRLASYTEKSQRFTKVDPNSYFLPESLKTPKDNSLISRQINLYQTALVSLTEKLKQKHGDDWRRYESSAKEDARFCLPLIIAAPLEMSLNGRELEYIIQKARSHPLSEVRRFSQLLEDQLKQKVPFVTNLIRYTSADSFYFQDSPQTSIREQGSNQQKRVVYINVDPEIDDKILASLLFEQDSSKSYEDALRFIKEQTSEYKTNFLKRKLAQMKVHQRPPKAFETSHITVSASISASCYAQLKRHRMLTLLTQEYNPSLGYTIPDSITEAGLKDAYLEIMKESSRRFLELNEAGNPEAPYILTNGHRRGILFTLNMRELYHFSRLRQDKHAQWEIKDLADVVVEEIKRRSPITGLLLCGKDTFEETRQRLYSN